MSAKLSIEKLEDRVLLSAVAVDFGQTLLQAGDIGVTTEGVEMARVTSGQAMLEVTDLNSNTRVDPGEITCVYAGNNLGMVVWSDVNGDIVTNLDADGTLSGAGDAGDVLNNSSIRFLDIYGEVNGAILAGGGVYNVTAARVEAIRVGTEAGGQSIDIDNTGGDDITLAAFVPGAGQAGGSVRNVTLSYVDTDIYAGDGGAGAAGGSVFDVVTSGGADLSIYAGDGGSNSVGGSGGHIARITAQNLSDMVYLYAGDGGDGSVGAGGLGGYIVSVNLSAGQLFAEAGDGGQGATVGGRGGSAYGIYLNMAGSGSCGITAGDGGDGDLVGGAGGAIHDATYMGPYGLNAYGGDGGGGGRLGGAGGSIWSLTSNTYAGDSAYYEGGTGGDAADDGGIGGAGGSIFGLNINHQYYSIYADAGAGGFGDLRGGNAGNVYNSTFNQIYDDYVYINDSGGDGGNSNTIGGNGGNVYNVTVNSGEYAYVYGGDGGDADWRGGAGGSIVNTRVDSHEYDYDITVQGGDGGDADNDMAGAVAGRGGDLINVTTMSAQYYAYYDGGNGGMASGAGSVGGRGGDIVNLHMLNTYAAPYAQAGNGGSGEGLGGRGGDVRGFYANVFGGEDNTRVYGGAGGASSAGTGGRGGHVVNTYSSSLYYSTYIDGGEGGTGDLVGGAGGSVVGFRTFSNDEYDYVSSGNGGPGELQGGAAGSIRNGVVNNASSDYYVEIDAAQGGNGGGGQGGVGGSILNVHVRTTSASNGYVEMHAGDGGAGDARGGNGGSISSSSAVGVDYVEAYGGDGGSAISEGYGGAGGSIISSRFVSGTEQTDVQAGDGGDGGWRGGSGGSLLGLSVQSGPESDLSLFAGDGGRATGEDTVVLGGAGGQVRGITVLGAGNVMVEGGDGGQVTTGNGLAGSGGNIVSVNVSRTVGVSVQYMAAGQGGDAAVGQAGNGGNIVGVTVNGFIGDTSGAANIDGLGGLYAGRGGTGPANGLNGYVYNVRAHGISMIGAGYPTSGTPLAGTDIFSARYVGGIVTDYLGIDTDANGVFDFTNNDGDVNYTAGDQPHDGYLHADLVGSIVNRRGLAVVPLYTSNV